ncbi:MAG: tetratricopeptide repeat protein [Candidatus Coatesbacteria bacterium]|nr:tetratricopeptide repeat protein [Candidatus Coatesbacteria bacterium]
MRSEILIGWIAGALLISLFLGSAYSGNDAETFRVGTGALKDQLWEIAANEFRALAGDSSKSPYAASATYYLGYCDFQLGQYAEVKRILSIYLSNWPSGEFSIQAKYHLARALFELGELERVRQLLEDVSSVAGELQDAGTFWLARWHYEQAEFDKSIELLKKLISSGSPQYMDAALYELSRAYSGAAKYVESIETARRLLKRPIEGEIHSQTVLLIASDLASLGRFDEAIKEALPLVEDPTRNATVHSKATALIADAHLKAGEPDKAMAYFQDFIANKPDARSERWASHQIAECMVSMSDCRGADGILHNRVEGFSERNISDLAAAIANCYSLQGEHGAAAAVLEFALSRLVNGDLRLLTGLQLAEAQFKAGDFSGVILQLSPLLARGLLNQDKEAAAAALVMVAESHERLNSLDEAERAYRLLLSLKPEESKIELALERLTSVLIRRGDLDAALGSLNQLVNSSKDLARIAQTAGRLVASFVKSGKRDRALKLAESTLTRFSEEAKRNENSSAQSARQAFFAELSRSQMCSILLSLAENSEGKMAPEGQAELLFAAAECCYIAGSTASASTIYLEVCRRYPEWRETYAASARLGAISFAEARFDDALKRFEAAAANAPPDKRCNLRYMVAESLFRMGRLPESLTLFLGVASAEGCDADVVQNACLKSGMIYEELGKFAEAVAAYERCRSMGCNEMATSVAGKRLSRLGG